MSKYNFPLILSCGIIISCFSVSAYGDSVDDMHDSAYELMKNEEYVKAIETYTTILKMKEYDDTALLNRAVAFAIIGDEKSSLDDFSLVLDKDSTNLTALNGKATILSNFECVSYNNCGPLESLQIFEKMLEIEPDNENILQKRNLMFVEGLSSNPKFAMFDVRETNEDYIVNIQQIVRDKDGNLVSVIENAGTDISPTLLTEKFLDRKEKDTTNFKKEIVRIGENDYIKWHYEYMINDSEKERKFFGLTKSFETVPDGEENGEKMLLRIDLILGLFPAVNVDVGDSVMKIVEVFKRI
tara:strand:+ start:84 stop:977 length:894 start_codon:yes stop_codon:yes gene_type:complete